MDYSTDPVRVKARQRAYACFEKKSQDSFQGIPLHQYIDHLVYAHRRGLMASPKGDVHLRGVMNAALSLAKHLEALDTFAEFVPPAPQWINPETLRVFARNLRDQYSGPPKPPKGTGAIPNVANRFLAFHCAEVLRGFGVRATSGKNGSIAKLASAIHTVATGEKVSFEWDAGLMRDPDHAPAELFKVAPPRRFSDQETEELLRQRSKRFRKQTK